RVALLTLCARALLVLELNCVVPTVAPLYWAVMLCGLPATVSVDTEQLAVFVPLPKGTTLQIVEAPSRKVTVPAPLGFGVAVTVAVWPLTPAPEDPFQLTLVDPLVTTIALDDSEAVVVVLALLIVTPSHAVAAWCTC